MNPLIFFVVIIAIDLFLKSRKDKKRMEEAQRKKMEELEKEKQDKDLSGKEGRVKREIPKNPSIIEHEKRERQKRMQKEKSFTGEGGEYREDHEGYRERYEERYDDMSEKYEEISESYEKRAYSVKKSKSEALYDKDAIKTRESKFGEKDFYKKREKMDVPIPQASTFKKDVLNGIIFSEILGKPKSMKKKDI